MNKETSFLVALVELANLQDNSETVARFSKKYRAYVNPSDVLKTRDELRELWRGGERASKIATRLLCEGPFMVNTANARVDWQSGTLVYRGQNQFQRDLYELLKVSERAKICANNCGTKYFIIPPTRRLSTRFCSSDCMHEANLRSKNKSWHKNKSKWKGKR